MKQLEAVLKVPKRDFLVIKAHADGPKRLFVALEAFAHEKENAATCVIAVDLDSLAVELVHEASGSSIDYAHTAGWHGILQREAVIELATKPTITMVNLGKDGTLAAIARADDVTLVSGTKPLGNYAIDGFVARVAAGKLDMLVETSKHGEAGPLTTLAVGRKGTVFAAGGAQAAGVRRFVMFRGDTRAVTEATPVADNQIHSLHQTSDGSIMVGCRDGAVLYQAGDARALTGVAGRVYGVTEFRGVEYWMSHDGADHVTLWRRAGTKLTKKYRTKYHYIGYRSVHGAPEARMTATDDLLVVTNHERIHVFDGKRWSQLAIQPKIKQLVKRLPAAMK